MRKTTSAAVAIIAWMPLQAAMARDLSSEVSPATVWFAVLVVVFALLVAVGLFVAHDNKDEHAIPSARQDKPARVTHARPRPMPRT